MLQCGHCKEFVIAKFIDNSSQSCNVIEDHREVIKYFPSCTPRTVPDNTPHKIAKYFDQATSSLEHANYDAAGAMFRKVIDITSKELGEKNGHLVQRINNLASKGLITKDMKDWADEIRLSGNEAVHDEEDYTKEECEEILHFTELFLMYTFTLPAMLENRRNSKKS